MLALDEHYDRFVGEPKERIYYDWSVRALRRMIVREPLTPRDALPPIDPDAQLQYDPSLRYRCFSPVSTPANTHAAIAATRAKSADLHAELHERIAAYLQEHGPQRTIKLAAGIGYRHSLVRDHLSDNKGKLYMMARKGPRVYWSLLP